MQFCFLIVSGALLFCSLFSPGQARALDMPSGGSEQAAGVVATVNGQPITLRQVESLYDINEGSAILARSPSVELLQEQYGASLATLIAQALIMQELEKRGFPVRDEDVRAAETTIRADYPPGEFERALQEDYIELEPWRELLRQRLAVQRFQERVLRPRFTITQQEVESEYAASNALLNQPEKVEIFWFEDLDKNRLEDVRTARLSEQGGGDDGPHADLLRISPNRLPELLRKDLAAIQPGQATAVRRDGDVYRFALLKARLPAHRLTPVEAYPLLEAALVERKLEPAYEAWLTETLASADIRIASRLKQQVSPAPASGHDGKDGPNPAAEMPEKGGRGDPEPDEGQD